MCLQDVLNTYCWIHSTYTIPSAFWKRIGFDVAHPGVDKTQDPLERRYHKYYQWVCFCLFFQVFISLEANVWAESHTHYLGVPSERQARHPPAISQYN